MISEVKYQKKILLTGASGFLGKGIVNHLERSHKHKLSLVFRKNDFSHGDRKFFVGDIDNSTDFHESLYRQDVVIHTAARVHIMRDNSGEAISKFRKVNVEGTLNLARQAVEAGVKRFIFVSSIKVNGEFTVGSKTFSEQDSPNPKDAYALSKYEAEKGLMAIANSSDMEVVILRPPLIYGPDVKGNFETLIKVVKSNFPLPFGLLDNRRSLVALDNLVNLITTCIDHPSAKNNVFLVSDGLDISSLDLVKEISRAYGAHPYIFSVSVSFMNIIANFLGKRQIAQRLFGNLRIDISKTCNLLDWKPTVSMAQQLKKMVDHDKSRIKK